MRFFLLILLNAAATNAESLCYGCVTQEMCTNNIRDTMVFFEKDNNQSLSRIARISEVVISIIKEEVENLNQEIMNSTESCRHHLLKETTKYYFNKSSTNCELKTCTKLDKSFIDEIKNFPADYMDTTLHRRKKYYCMFIVPGLNYRCMKKRYYLRHIMRCDFKNNFELQFKQPWLNCVEKVKEGNRKNL